MALLRAWPRLLALLGCAQLAACADTASLGHANGSLRACAGADACDAAEPEAFGVQAYFDAQVSRYAPHGFYAYFELERNDGQRAVLELDVPIDSGSESVAADQVSYRELDGDRLSFESKQVQGQLQLPRSLVQEDAQACGCADALFNLRFVAPGADGLLGTQDDLTRELYYGHLSRTGATCAAQLAPTENTDLRVQVRACDPPPLAATPSVRTPPEPARAPRAAGTASCSYRDCYADDPGYATSESGCGSTTYSETGCGGTSDDQAGGCSSSESSRSHSGGCADSSDKDNQSSNSGSGDSSDDSHSSSNSGCEGDTSKSSSSSSCSTARVQRRDLRSFLGTGLPLLLVCAWQARRARRMRQAQSSA